MTDPVCQTERTFQPSASLKIVAGTALIATLAGAGIAAIDYPWQASFGKSEQRDAQRKQIVTAALAARSLPAVPPPSLPAQVSPERPAAAAKPAVRLASKRQPRTPRALSASSAKVSAAPAAPSIDARYDRRARTECARGIEGLICRETVRWRLCNGHWNDGSEPGATRCNVGKAGNGLPPSG